jgi:pimeloyl-ACP methyl ester carboxylesterase
MCFTYAKLLASMRYAAITFDFCGGGPMNRSEGNSEDMTVMTEVQDLEAVLDAVKNMEDVDSEQISLLGCSQGGFVSALAATKHPEIKNLVLLYPAFCIPDHARAGQMMMIQFDPANMPEILCYKPMKIGRSYAAEVLDWDYREKIRGYHGKTILIHGTKDDVVDLRYAREARECYDDCHYYEIEGGGHVFTGVHDEEAKAILKRELALGEDENK